jgi:hypothetical protein
MAGRTDELIAHLSANVKVVRRLWSPERRLAVWILAVVIYVVAMTAAGHSGLLRASAPLIWQELAACILAVSSAYAAFLTVVPGRRAHWLIGAAAFAAGAWLVILMAASVTEYQSTGVIGGFAGETDWPCIASIAITGSVLAGLMLAMLRRGAPLTPRPSVALAAIAAATVASMSTILIWHGMTSAALVVVFVANARRFLSWHYSHIEPRHRLT